MANVRRMVFSCPSLPVVLTLVSCVLVFHVHYSLLVVCIDYFLLTSPKKSFFLPLFPPFFLLDVFLIRDTFWSGSQFDLSFNVSLAFLLQFLGFSPGVSQMFAC